MRQFVNSVGLVDHKEMRKTDCFGETRLIMSWKAIVILFVIIIILIMTITTLQSVPCPAPLQDSFLLSRHIAAVLPGDSVIPSRCCHTAPASAETFSACDVQAPRV